MTKSAANNKNSRDLFEWDAIMRLESNIKIAKANRDAAFWAKVRAPFGKIKLRNEELKTANHALLKAELELDQMKLKFNTK